MFSKLPLVLLPLLLLSCSSTRHYYILTPSGKPPSHQGKGIGIGPVTIADYLVEKPYVVFQSSPNRMEISDLQEWAGDLRSNFTRVLGTNLGRRMNTGNIRSYPWDRKNELQYQVTVDLSQFHGTSDGDAILEASWRAYSLPGGRLITTQTTTLLEPMTEDGFDALVAAQSRLVDQLAAEIAAQLK